jgi:hypothetical protein
LEFRRKKASLVADFSQIPGRNDMSWMSFLRLSGIIKKELQIL